METIHSHTFDQLMEEVKPNRPILFARLCNKFEGDYDQIMDWINLKKEKRNGRMEKMKQRGRNMTEFKPTFDMIYEKVEPKQPILFAKVVNQFNGDFQTSLNFLESSTGGKRGHLILHHRRRRSVVGRRGEGRGLGKSGNH